MTAVFFRLWKKLVKIKLFVKCQNWFFLHIHLEKLDKILFSEF